MKNDSTWIVVRDQTDPLDTHVYGHRDDQGHLHVDDRPMLFRNRSVAKKIRQRLNREYHGQFCEQPFTGAPLYYVQGRCAETGLWVDAYSAPFETLEAAQDVLGGHEGTTVRVVTEFADPITDPFTATAEFQRGLRRVLDRGWDPHADVLVHIPDFGTPGNSA